MDDHVIVTMSGLPGKMATLVAETIEKKGGRHNLKLDREALTGPNQPDECTIKGEVINLIPPKEHEEYFEKLVGYEQIVVDFSQPNAVNKNAELYCLYNVPFVMGTTGGNRAALEKLVEQSGNTAVIAPNMAKPIVLLQSMFDYAAENFPDALADFNMMITESHQDTKRDTSGTAKAMIKYFNKLGVPFAVEGIRKIRNRFEQQTLIDIPQEYLGGHGYHTYTLKSEDGTVKLQLQHNVNGRQVYADGTIDAIKFLREKIDRGKKGVYSMIDVLKGE